MLILPALLMGLVGSIHCLGMCGPIIVVLPGTGSERLRFFVSRLLYNIGRTLTYGFLGLIAGLIGQTFALAGYQQTLGIVSGSLMIISVLLPSGFLRRVVPWKGFQRMVEAVKNRLGRLLADGSTSSLLTIGILNGFLPCGLVYAALAASLAAGSIPGSVAFMLMFGLGTLPALFAASYAVNLVTMNIRRKLTRLLPAGVALMGVLFILRGLSLGIPFISPDMEKMKMKAKPPAPREVVKEKPACCE
jgi:uncharacterized protein